MGLSALPGQSSTLPSLVSSCLVPSAPPVPGPFRVCQGASWDFSGVISGLFLGARSRQKSSRKAPEAARRAQRSPQGGRREVTKRLRRPTGGPQGAPRGRGKRKTTNFTRLSGFAARKGDVNYVVLVARPLQPPGLAVLFLEKPRPNRHFWGPSCSEPRKTREICDPKLSPIIEPSWPLLGRLGALGGSWAARGGSWASLGLSPGPPEGAQSVVKHEGFAISTQSGPGPLWRRRFEIRCVLRGFGPPRVRK